MRRSSLVAFVGALSLGSLLAIWPPAAAAGDSPVLPMKICLRQPKTVQVHGQATLRCPGAVSIVPKRTVFYLLVSVADPRGLQTYALNWSVQRWQPKTHRWATLRQEVGTDIQPDWQYVWLVQQGLAPGSYRAFVYTDFLAKLVEAPIFEFAASFKVH